MDKKTSSKVTLGKLSHIGIVVRDIDKAIEYYTLRLRPGTFHDGGLRPQVVHL